MCYHHIIISLFLGFLVKKFEDCVLCILFMQLLTPILVSTPIFVQVIKPDARNCAEF